MTAPSIRNLSFLAVLLFASTLEVCHATPTRLFRATQKFADWIKESDVIVECYRQSYNPPAESKIIPLFLCVHLGLGESVGESGASVHESAFVYSEVRLANGNKERKINVFSRSPYESRKWTAVPIIKITEMQESLFGVCLLEESVDLYKQISEYAKKVTSPGNSREYTIYMIAFNDNITNLLGRNLEDEAILQMIFQNKDNSIEHKEKK